jgi:hypothetical protein
MTCVAAKGYELLRFLFTQDADYLSLNLGLPECQYGLDADMIEILLERPEPADAAPEPVRMVAEPEGDPAKFLGPVKELLARDATVRAAWIFEAKGTEPLPRGHCQLRAGAADAEPGRRTPAAPSGADGEGADTGADGLGRHAAARGGCGLRQSGRAAAAVLPCEGISGRFLSVV